MQIARLWAEIGADLSGLELGLSKAETRLARSGDNMAQIGQRMSLGLTLPLLGAGAVAVKTAVDFERLEMGLGVVAGSTEAAARQLEELERIARMPGLGFKESISGAIDLNVAFEGIPNRIALTNRALRQFGNAIALTGGGRSELQLVITQLGQIAAAGTVLTQDLRPIIQTAPAVAQALREAFGTISPEAINALGLSSEEFFEQLLDGLEKLPRAAAGTANTFENLADASAKAGDAIGDALLPVVVPTVEGLADMLEGVADLNPEIMKWGVAMGATTAAGGPLLILVGNLTTAATLLSASLKIGLLPLLGAGGLIALGLGAVSTAFIKVGLDAMEARSQGLEFAAGMEEARQATEDMASAVAELSVAQKQALFSDLSAGLAMLRARRDELEEDLERARNRHQVLAAGRGGGSTLQAAERVRQLQADLGGVNRQLDMFMQMLGQTAQGWFSEPAGGGGGGGVEGLLGVSPEALSGVRDPLAIITAELESLSDKADDLRLGLALAESEDERKKLQEDLEAIIRRMERLQQLAAPLRFDAAARPDFGLTDSGANAVAAQLQIPPTGGVAAIHRPDVNEMFGIVSDLADRFEHLGVTIEEVIDLVAPEKMRDELRSRAGLRSTSELAGLTAAQLGQLMGGAGGQLFGGVGAALSGYSGAKAGMEAGGLDAVVGMMPMVGGVVTAFQGLTAILGDNKSAVERAAEAWNEFTAGLDLRFDVLDVSVQEQWDALLQGFIEQFGEGVFDEWSHPVMSGSFDLEDILGLEAPDLSELTLENFDQYAEALLDWLEAVKELPGDTPWEGPFEALIRALAALADSAEDAGNALGEAAKVLHAPQGVLVNLRRFQAMQAETPQLRSNLPRRPGRDEGRTPTTAQYSFGDIHVEAFRTPEEAWENFERGVENAARSGDALALSLLYGDS